MIFAPINMSIAGWMDGGNVVYTSNGTDLALKMKEILPHVKKMNEPWENRCFCLQRIILISSLCESNEKIKDKILKTKDTEFFSLC